MTKVSEKVDEVKNGISKLQSEFSTRIENLNQIITTLETDIKEAETKQSEADGKAITVENEIKVHEANVDDEKKTIKDLESKLGELNPEIEKKNSTLKELETTISELKAKNEQLDKEISENTAKKDELTKEKEQKDQAFTDLDTSLEKDVANIQAKLAEVKEEYDKFLESNLVWEYLFDIIETPEIEIMAIIAANPEISMDDIKSKATTVQAVFVGRSISKLEADGQIVNKDGKWDLSPSLLAAIN